MHLLKYDGYMVSVGASGSSSLGLSPDQRHCIVLSGKILYSLRVVYKSPQPAKFAGFSAKFRRLLSLLHESGYVKEMMFIRSHNCLLFTKLWLLKNLKKTLTTLAVMHAKSYIFF